MRLQYNKTTNRTYEGGNQAVLMGEKDRNNYKSNAWLTFIQARAAGYRLVKAKGKGVSLRTFVSDGIDEHGETVIKPVHFVVFNSDLVKKWKAR